MMPGLFCSSNSDGEMVGDFSECQIKLLIAVNFFVCSYRRYFTW